MFKITFNSNDKEYEYIDLPTAQLRSEERNCISKGDTRLILGEMFYVVNVFEYHSSSLQSLFFEPDRARVSWCSVAVTAANPGDDQYNERKALKDRILEHL